MCLTQMLLVGSAVHDAYILPCLMRQKKAAFTENERILFTFSSHMQSLVCQSVEHNGQRLRWSYICVDFIRFIL
jgi:hypothetical protein